MIIDYQSLNLRLQEVSTTTPEAGDLKSIVTDLIDGLAQQQRDNASIPVLVTDSHEKLAELTKRVEELTKRVEELTTRERAMDSAGTPQEIRPAAHRAIDRLDVSPPTGGDNG